MRSSGLVFAAALLGPAFVSLSAVSPASPGVIQITATAEQKFVPDHIVLHVGKAQKLRFVSTGGVHGIASPDLGIPATTLMPDKPVSFQVTPKKAGTLVMPCTIVCGANHADMALTVEVKP